MSPSGVYQVFTMKIQSVFVLPQSLYSRYCTTHLVPWNLYIISYLSISLGSSWFFCLWYNSLPQPFSCWGIIAQLNVTPSPRHPIPNTLLGSPVQCSSQTTFFPHPISLQQFPRIFGTWVWALQGQEPSHHSLSWKCFFCLFFILLYFQETMKRCNITLEDR